MMNKRWIIYWLMVFGFIVHGMRLSVKAAYGINRTINFQGKLVDSNGVNVPNSTPVTATFSIYESNDSCPGGGTAVWSEDQTFTPVDGIFQVALGSQTAFGSSIDFSQDTLYLGIKISTEASEMCSGSARIKLAAVPQAFNAERFAGLTADNSQTNYFTITGGQGTAATLKVNGDITVGSIITPTSAGGLTIQSNGANDMTVDSGTTGNVNVGTGANAKTIYIGTAAVANTITIGSASATGVSITDNNWSIGTDGTASFGSNGVELADSDTNPACAAGDYKIYADTSDARLKKCQDGVVSDLARDADVIFKAKSADQSVTNDTTLTDETALQFTLGGSEEWNVMWDLMVANNNSATPGWKAAVVGPAANSCNVLQSGAEPAGAAFPQATTTDCIEAPGSLVNDTIDASSTPFMVNIAANITGGGTGGTVKVQFAENTAGGGTSVTVMAGSIMTAYRVTGADLAEFYYTRYGTLEPGDVVAWDSLMIDGVMKTSRAYDPQTLGVISTKPGLVMGGSSGTSGGFPALVALLGRVPVKVTAENGPIRPGDLLTASSIPGVAMKMIKAGTSIGMATTGYSDPGVGMVTVIVKTGYAAGAKVLDLAAESGSEPVKTLLNLGETGRAALQYVLENEAILKGSPDLSEMLTDRVVAGLEMVTPSLIADKVFARVISGLGKEKLTIETDGGQIAFAASGSAVFSGGVTADWIKANRIEGLEILTRKFTGLEDKLASLSPMPSPTDSPVAALDMTILGDLVASKALTVNGQATFYDKVEFKSPVTFEGVPLFNQDTAGFAIIKKDTDRVDIVFDKEYPEPPVVSVNMAVDLRKNADGTTNDNENNELEKQMLGGNYAYIVTRKTTKGFRVILNKTAGADLTFSWTVFAAKNPKTFSSMIGPPAILGEEIMISPTPLATPVVTPTDVPAAATGSGETRAVDLGG
jgi:hypothetical protein